MFDGLSKREIAGALLGAALGGPILYALAYYYIILLGVLAA